jgi:AbrB family transcriptional regulator (stage V sporulation protein T)
MDELGRVVIPKEIRRTMRIREGYPLEIFKDHDGEVIFKKYSMIGNWSSQADNLCESFSKISGRQIIVSDRDTIVAGSSGVKREVLDKLVNDEISDIINSRKKYAKTAGDKEISITEYGKHIAGSVHPIISRGDILGSVILVTEADEAPSEADLRMAAMIADFLADQSGN